MNCTTYNVTLFLAEKQGIDIDYCPQCRGIWLEKGKLDKMSSSGPPNYGGYIPDNHHYDKHDDHQYPDGHRRKKDC